jgi:large conductance mechanosensitive channel
MPKDFKTFITRGNVVTSAVGIIIGADSGTVASSIVKDVVMPRLVWLWVK